jgi:hypothetical protein
MPVRDRLSSRNPQKTTTPPNKTELPDNLFVQLHNIFDWILREGRILPNRPLCLEMNKYSNGKSQKNTGKK